MAEVERKAAGQVRLLHLLEAQRAIRSQLEQQYELMQHARAKLARGELKSTGVPAIRPKEKRSALKTSSSGKKGAHNAANIARADAEARLREVDDAMQAKHAKLTDQFLELQRQIEAGEEHQEAELRELVFSADSSQLEHTAQRWLQLTPTEAQAYKTQALRAYELQQQSQMTSSARSAQEAVLHQAVSPRMQQLAAALEAAFASHSPTKVASTKNVDSNTAMPFFETSLRKKDRRQAEKAERELKRSEKLLSKKTAAASLRLSAVAPTERRTIVPNVMAAEAARMALARAASRAQRAPAEAVVLSPPRGSGSTECVEDIDIGYITDLETESQNERERQAQAVCDMLATTSGTRYILSWEQVSSAAGFDGSDSCLQTNESARVLGEGAFARVYKGMLCGQACAIKVIKRSQSDKSLRSFVREVALLAQLCGESGGIHGGLPTRANPHLVRFLGCVPGPEPDRFAIVTELCAGGSLHSSLYSRNIKFSVRHIISMATHLALALLSLHDADIIHRDCTSHNVLILNEISNGEEPVIQLCDLGISRVHREQGGPVKMSPIGNPRWVAPEIVRREPYNNAVDIWSFGAVLYELLTSRMPYCAIGTEREILAAIASGTPPPFPDNCEPNLRDIAFKCLSSDASSRPKLRATVGVLTRLRFTIPQDRMDAPAMIRLLDLTSSQELSFKQQQIQKYEAQQSESVRATRAPRLAPGLPVAMHKLPADKYLSHYRRQQQHEVLLRTIRTQF